MTALFSLPVESQLRFVVRMSLNRCEQRVLDYVTGHADERQHWQGKVQSAVRRATDTHAAARLLEPELWDYYCERAQVAEPFRSAARSEGLTRTSMRSLAEYWLRLWAPTAPRPEFKGTYDGYGA